MKEEVVGVFEVDEPRKFGWRHYTMYLTNKRMILGKIGSGPALSSDSESYMKIGTAFINQGFLGLARLAIQKDDSHKYDNMNFEEILEAGKDNFAVDYQNELKSVELKERTLGIGKGIPSRIVISPTHGKKKTLLFNKEYFDDLRSLLQKLTANKLVIK